jgi:hypothetical protein
MKIANRFFEDAVKFQYLGTTLTVFMKRLTRAY